MRTMLAAKLHGLTVTGASLDYNGSVSIDSAVMAQADILPGEQVHVVSLSTGARWVTYALPAEHGEFTVNGAGARLAQPGDRVIVMTYRSSDERSPATALFFGLGNEVIRTVWPYP